jgi:hypothetical protein
MRSTNRITPKLVVALVMAGLTLIGSVARSTWAQEGAKVDPQTAPPEAPQQAAGPSSLPPSDGGSKPFEPPSTSGLAVVDSLVTSSSVLPGNEEPEKSARAFVEQNRKTAQGELKNLKDEAERLRTRLGKVEAGIRRWEVLVAALDESEKVLASGTERPNRAESPKAARWSGVEKK